jgi:tRNA(Ile)-lysidine synthase
VPPPDLRAVVRSSALEFAGRGARVAIALSGGVDSVVLLDVLADLREELVLELVALHAHHGISANADRWEAACADQCLRRDIAFEAVRLDLGALAGQSLEAVARRARYDALEAVAGRRGTGTLALGHHLDDQAETFVLQALRGASAHGLAAMPPLRTTGGGLRLWRPLLAVPRAAIVRYAESKGLDWVVDESNADVRFKRNLLRKRVLPSIEDGFPGYRTALVRASRRAAEAAELVDALGRLDAETCSVGDALSVSQLRTLGPLRARNAIRLHIAASGNTLPDIDQLDEFVRQALTAKADRHPSLPLDSTHMLFATRGEIRVLPAAEIVDFRVVWRGDRTVVLPHGVVHFTETRGAGVCASRLREATCEIRSRAGGERLRPAANRRSRTLKNLFQEAAVSAPLRRNWPLLVSDESLVAVPGVAIDVDWQCPADREGWIVTWTAAEER